MLFFLGMRRRHVKILLILLVVNLIVALIFYRWLTIRPAHTNRSVEDLKISSPFTTRSCRLATRTTVTLVTQTSVNNLGLLDLLQQVWSGPVEVAVMLYSREEGDILMSFLTRFFGCHADAQCSFRFHVVAQVDSSFSLPIWTSSELREDKLCEAESAVPSSSMKNFQHPRPYPINLLRNVAVSGVSSDFHMVLDVDTLPSVGLAPKLNKFLLQTGTTALAKDVCFILPVFEIMDNGSMPLSKAKLKSLYKTGAARPFYHAVNERCQGATNYGKWLTLPEGRDIQLAYEVMWENPYEPFFFCLSSSSPKFNEQFTQYGINRLSQVCETHMGGKDFVVLSDGFLVHRGFKSSQSFHSEKRDQLALNQQIYSKFARELISNYPNSQRSC